MKKQAYSKPYNLVLENNYPNLVIGPGFYKNNKFAEKSDPINWKNKKLYEIDYQRKKQEFTFKEFSKKEAINPKKELEDLQWIAQSKKIAEFEIDFENKKKIINEKVSGIENNAYPLTNLKITKNIKIPKAIDKITNDTSLNAREGMLELYSKIDDVYKIEQLLSIGLLGTKKNRILVPTKWAITSVDDTIGKEIINSLKDYSLIEKIELFVFEFLENKFYIILLPYPWGFEMIEKQIEKFTIDFEIGAPKKDYAKNVIGAYYAARLEIARYFQKNKKKGLGIIFRDISPTYYSRGVWVIREAVKLALEKKPLYFETKEKLFNYLKENSFSSTWIEQSNLIKNIRFQKRIFEF